MHIVCISMHKHIFMYVYMYLYVHIDSSRHIRKRKHCNTLQHTATTLQHIVRITDLQISVYEYTFIHIHLYTYVARWSQLCPNIHQERTCVYLYIRTYVCIHICVHAQRESERTGEKERETHTHMYTHMYTHMCAHIHALTSTLMLHTVAGHWRYATCNKPQHTVTHCTLQHSAIHCNALQLTALHCKTYWHCGTCTVL